MICGGRRSMTMLGPIVLSKSLPLPSMAALGLAPAMMGESDGRLRT